MPPTSPERLHDTPPHPTDVAVVEAASSTDLAHRRTLALEAVQTVGEVFGIEEPIHVPHLIRLANSEEPQDVRLPAVRMLRYIATASDPEHPLTSFIGTGVDKYHVAEAVVRYGASSQNYLKLLGCGLTAEQVTGLYALRELIRDYTGRYSGFPTIAKALERVGWSLHDAGSDPYGAIEQFDEAGLITDHVGGRQYNQPILYVPRQDPVRVEGDPDGSITAGIYEQLASMRDDSDRDDLSHVPDLQAQVARVVAARAARH